MRPSFAYAFFSIRTHAENMRTYLFLKRISTACIFHVAEKNIINFVNDVGLHKTWTIVILHKTSELLKKKKNVQIVPNFWEGGQNIFMGQCAISHELWFSLSWRKVFTRFICEDTHFRHLRIPRISNNVCPLTLIRLHLSISGFPQERNHIADSFYRKPVF